MLRHQLVLHREPALLRTKIGSCESAQQAIRFAFSFAELLKGVLMARKTILVPDLSGREIDEKDAHKVTITYADARRGQVVLDVNASEVEDWARKATRQARRGRRPRTG
jgi:hypothetical protein